MPRPTRTEVSALLQEARAVELLAEEAEVAPESLQAYWSVSADLITLVAEIEKLQAERSGAGADDPEIFALRHRLRQVASRLMELSLE
jgi:hypothetical protein